MKRSFNIMLYVLPILFICVMLSFSCNASSYYDDEEDEYNYEDVTVSNVRISDVYVKTGNIIQITFKSEDTYDSDDDYYYNAGNYDGYELFRSNLENGEYKLISSGNIDSNKETFTCTDSNAVMGQTYFYKIRFRNTIYKSGVTYSYGKFCSPLKVTAIQSPGKINYVRATKAKTFTIKWNAVSNIDGYEIYMKELKNDYLWGLHYYSQYEQDGLINDLNDYYDNSIDEINKIEYKKVATIKSAKSTSYKYKKAKHGYGYLVAIRTYKIVNGKKVTSTVAYCSHGVMDYYFCPNAENKKFVYKWPKTQKKARGMCTQIKVKVWDYVNHARHKGKKKTRTLYIVVNKKYASTIKQIYKEIYKNKKKPPIYEAGSYRWRKEEAKWSYHTVGTAIDMNCNENPYYSYVNGKRKIAVGSFYKPKSNQYSMPRNGVIEKTFAKYGFVRLNNDLMHYNAEYVESSSNY